MRVALVAPDIPDYGTEFAAVAAGRLDARLFIPDWFVDSHLPCLEGHIEAQWVRWPRQREILTGMWRIWQVARAIRGFEPDFVHILAEGNAWNLVLQRLLRPIPVMTTVHDIECHPGDTASQRVPRSIISALIKRSAAVIVHGTSLSKLLARSMPGCADKIFVFPHIPIMRYKLNAEEWGHAKPDDKLRVLFFGRIYDYKGLEYLIEAVPSILAAIPRVKIVIAGSGNILKYRDRIDALSCIEVRNRFIPFQEVGRLFAEADLLVLPYIEASQSGVLMAALPFELPVIATSVGEIGETVQSTGIGLVIAPRDKDELARAVIHVLTNSALKSRLSEAAHAKMRGQFSRRVLSAQLEMLYAAAMKRRETRFPAENPET